MPPLLALAIGFGLVIWLLRTDFRHRSTGASALWVPALLVLIGASRPVNYWVEMMGLASGGESNSESSPANLLTLLFIISSAVWVLVQRQAPFAKIISENKTLFLLYLYFMISSVWSPDAFVSFRRIIKDMGIVFVALVVLTSPKPWMSLRVLFVRCSYFILPISLVTSKYFPTVGRYTSKSWESFYTGLTTHKNTLGLVALIFLLFLIWDYVDCPKEIAPENLKLAKRQRLLVIGIGVALILMAQSATSQICLMLGLGLFFYVRRLSALPNGRRKFHTALISVVVLAAADKMLGISPMIAEAFGRNMTLTGRTAIWDVALSHQQSFLHGFGYNAFWDTDLAFVVYDELGDFIHIRTVHNGYLEVFLDGGIIGVGMLALFLIGTFLKTYRRAFVLRPMQAMPLALFFVTAIYNNSESSFLRSDLLWYVFLTISLDTVAMPHSVSEEPDPDYLPLDEPEEHHV